MRCSDLRGRTKGPKQPWDTGLYCLPEMRAIVKVVHKNWYHNIQYCNFKYYNVRSSISVDNRICVFIEYLLKMTQQKHIKVWHTLRRTFYIIRNSHKCLWKRENLHCFKIWRDLTRPIASEKQTSTEEWGSVPNSQRGHTEAA